MAATKKTRVLILGGGFGDLYAALEFEKRLDVFFSKDFVQYLDQRALAIPRQKRGWCLGRATFASRETR